MFFSRGKKKKKERGEGSVRFIDIPSRVDIPQPKGPFRNLFAERGMMPEKMKAKPDAPKPEWCIICGKEGCDVLQ